MWPVALDIDDSIARLAPGEFRPGGPLSGSEVQIVRDRQGVLGPRILLTRPGQASTVDYLWPPWLDLEPAAVPLGEGIRFNEPCEVHRWEFEIGDDGVHLDVDLVDPLGVRFVYRLDAPGPWRGTDFVAPPAAGMTHPRSLFMPLLGGFDLITHARLRTEIRYGDETLRLGAMPLLRRSGPASTQKACTSATIVELLPDGAAPVALDADGACTSAGQLLLDGGDLAALTGGAGDDAVTLEFLDPLPPSARLDRPFLTDWRLRWRDQTTAAGSWCITPDAHGHAVEVDVTSGWRGSHGVLSMDVATRVVPFFRWQRHYSWRGRLEGGALTGSWTNAAPWLDRTAPVSSAP
ncbi:MAG: hypothetical protein Q4G43_02815 [Mobilicoccus sp.]|nr:hypothetical protein [Mobilicoccus sp.]